MNWKQAGTDPELSSLKLVPKRQLIITGQLVGHVLSMYAKGMSTRTISDFIREMYAMEISATEISRITEKNLLAFEEM